MGDEKADDISHTETSNSENVQENEQKDNSESGKTDKVKGVYPCVYT